MTAPPGVRVLIVDDSPVAREVLKTVLESDAGIRVVGMAGTGHEAVELTGRLRPDLVTMDLMMPGMDGMEATQRIMARYPTPILFLSAFIGREGSYSRSDALAAGALDVVEKPSTMPDLQWQMEAGSLVEKIKSLAKVTVVTHMHRASRDQRSPSSAARRAATHVVAIGASTGGPKVLDDLLSSLPSGYGPERRRCGRFFAHPQRRNVCHWRRDPARLDFYQCDNSTAGVALGRLLPAERKARRDDRRPVARPRSPWLRSRPCVCQSGAAPSTSYAGFHNPAQ